MPKYEIEIDLPAELLAKWKPVAFRGAKTNEMFFDSTGNVGKWMLEDTSNALRIILEPIKRYRTPSLPEDDGKLCEFSNDGFKTVVAGRLQAYFNTEDYQPWTMFEGNWFADCRIEVTE